jgi:hypothetical protein
MESKPARDAAAKAKMEGEASAADEGPIHQDNEWNIRYIFCIKLHYFLLRILVPLCILNKYWQHSFRTWLFPRATGLDVTDA